MFFLKTCCKILRCKILFFADAQRNLKRECVGIRFQVVAWSSQDQLDVPISKFGSWRTPMPDHLSERRFRAFPRSESNFMSLRGQHDFKIQWSLYLLQPDWLIRLFPSNLETNSHPFSLWPSLGVRDSLVPRSNTNQLTNRMANPREKHMEKYG